VDYGSKINIGILTHFQQVTFVSKSAMIFFYKKIPFWIKNFPHGEKSCINFIFVIAIQPGNGFLCFWAQKKGKP